MWRFHQQPPSNCNRGWVLWSKCCLQPITSIYRGHCPRHENDGELQSGQCTALCGGFTWYPPAMAPQFVCMHGYAASRQQLMWGCHSIYIGGVLQCSSAVLIVGSFCPPLSSSLISNQVPRFSSWQHERMGPSQIFVRHGGGWVWQGMPPDDVSPESRFNLAEN